MSLCTNKIENCIRIIPDCITANTLCALLKGLFLRISMIVQGTVERKETQRRDKEKKSEETEEIFIQFQ